MQTLTRRGVGDAAAGLSLHFLHMSEGPFSHSAGHNDVLKELSINHVSFSFVQKNELSNKYIEYTKRFFFQTKICLLSNGHDVYSLLSLEDYGK